LRQQFVSLSKTGRRSSAPRLRLMQSNQTGDAAISAEFPTVCGVAGRHSCFSLPNAEKGAESV
jgi:hypothetical protein